MSGGQFVVPLTVRAAQGGSNGFGSQHSQCAESWLMSVPGIKVVVPATPTDAYGLLRGAIREDNPVFVLEHKALYNLREMGEALIPYSPPLEDAALPNVERIMQSVRQMMRF